MEKVCEDIMDAHVMRLLKVCFGKEGGGSMLMLLLPPYTRNEFPAYSPLPV